MNGLVVYFKQEESALFLFINQMDLKIKSFEKARAVLVLNFIVLFVLVISIPSLIRRGTPLFREETVESFFLTLGLLALLYIFRHYDYFMKKKEEETLWLNSKLKTREKELLDSFQYLGKVNVQISMIKSLLEKMEIPKSKNRLKEIYEELLLLVCGITGRQKAFLRIINLETGRTLSEQCISSSEAGDANEFNVKAGNIDLANKFKEKEKIEISGYSVFYSHSENFFIKAFVFVPDDDRKKDYSSEENFLEAVASQCEILFLLFNSGYYKEE